MRTNRLSVFFLLIDYCAKQVSAGMGGRHFRWRKNLELELVSNRRGFANSSNNSCGVHLLGLIVSAALLFSLTGCNLVNMHLSRKDDHDVPLPYSYSYKTNAEADLNAVIGNGTDLFAAGDFGQLFISRDRGLHWSASGINGAELLSLCRSGDTVIVTGRSGTILVSTDAGRSWTARGPRTTSGLFSCYFEGTALYVGGDNGAIFRSDDLGLKWSSIPSPNTKTVIRSITASREQGLLILGTDAGEIFTGNEAKYRWTKVWSSPEAINSIAHDSSEGAFLAVGNNGLIVRSTDHGQSWNKLNFPFTRSLVTLVYGSESKSFVVAGGQGFMATSGDGGLSWSRVYLPMNWSVRGVYVGPLGELVVVGMKGTILVGSAENMVLSRGSPYDFKGIFSASQKGMFLYGAGGVIRHSLDHGLNWHNELLETDSTINSLTECAGIIWAVGEHGVVITSKNGDAWQLRRTQPDVSLNGVACSADGQNMFIVGGSGTIETSHDRGKTWNVAAPSSHANLNTASTVRDLVIVGGDDGTLLKSNLRSATWSDVSQDSIYNFTSIQIAPDAKHVWAFGTNGAVFFSHNSGADWDYDDNRVSDDLQSSICLAQCATVAAVGDHGTLVIRGASDEDWSYTTKTRFALRSITIGAGDAVYVLGADARLYKPKRLKAIWQTDELGQVQDAFASRDGNHIWGAGENGIVWESKDGGVHWISHDTGLHKELVGIAGDELGLNVAAVSYGGFCVRSADAGKSWVTEKIAKNDLNDIKWIGNTFWAVGDRGIIEKFDTVKQTWSNAVSLGPMSLLAIGGSSDGVSLFAAGSAGTVARSTDGGKNWSTQTIGDTEFNSLVVYGTSQTKIVAVGDSGVVGFSRDKGDTWEIRPLGGGHLYRVTYSPRTQQLFAVGENGKLLISDDDGETWNSKASGTDSDLRSILSVDNGNQLYALGDGGAFEKYAIFSQRAVSEIAHFTHILSKISLSIGFSGANIPNNPTFTARARRVNELKRTEPISVPTHVGNHIDPDDPWNITFDLDDLHPTPGEIFDLELCFRDGSYQRCNPLSRVTAIPLIDIRKNAKWIVPSGVILSSVTILECLLFVQPLWILALYRKAYIYDAIGNSSLPGAKLIKSLLQGTLLPWFAFQPRTLSAWAKQHRRKLASSVERDLRTSIAIGSGSIYVSLPVDIQEGNHLRLTLEPSRDTFIAFAHKSIVLEICGPGGIGKTTLMKQCAAWLSDTDPSKRDNAVGVIAIGPYSGDLISYIAKKLAKITEDDVSDDLARQLLRKGILIPLIDSVSELEDSMQAKLREDLNTTVTRLVILTTRETTGLSSMDRVVISPRPLDSRTLLHFITSLLSAAPSEIDKINSMEFQLDIGIRIARLMTTAGTEIPLTPLLAKLYVDRAIELMRTGTTMEELPTSIAETYFEFIRLLLRKEPDLDQITALSCIKRIGKLSLGERFIPSKRGIEEVLANLRDVVADRAMSVVRTLVAAGVFTEEQMGLGKAITFSLDPVAEFCAAYAYAEELGFDFDAWSKFRDKVSSSGSPAGFCSALRVVVQSAARRGLVTGQVTSWFA